jgi:hypothetical protein
MKDGYMFYGHFVNFYDQMVYFVPMWNILWSFGIFFHRFGMLHREKSGNPGSFQKDVF